MNTFTANRLFSLFLERDYTSTKYVPLLDNVDPDLAAKLDVLSSKGNDQKHLKNWNKARPMKQTSLSPAPWQGRRKQSAVGIMVKKKTKT